MTPAELKTLRESLGLSEQWVAERAGVQLRTVQYWEDGQDSVPVDVANMIEHIDETVNLSVKNNLKKIKATNKKGDEIALIRYRTDDDLWSFTTDMAPLPAACHAAMQARLRRALLDSGYLPFIVYMQVNHYRKWLKGRADNETLRAKWAKTVR